MNDLALLAELGIEVDIPRLVAVMMVSGLIVRITKTRVTISSQVWPLISALIGVALSLLGELSLESGVAGGIAGLLAVSVHEGIKLSIPEGKRVQLLGKAKS